MAARRTASRRSRPRRRSPRAGPRAARPSRARPPGRRRRGAASSGASSRRPSRARSPVGPDLPLRGRLDQGVEQRRAATGVGAGRRRRPGRRPSARSAGLAERGDQASGRRPPGRPAILPGPERLDQRLDHRRASRPPRARRPGAAGCRRSRTGPPATAGSQYGLQVAGGQPEGVVEEPVDRPVERPQRQLGRAAARGSWPSARTASSRTRGMVVGDPRRRAGRAGRRAGRASAATTRTAAARTRGSAESSSRREQVGLDHVERLVGPEGFEPVVLGLGVVRVEPLDPGRQRGDDRRRPALLEHALGVVPGPVLGGLQGVEQRLGRRRRRASAARRAGGPWR